MPVVLGILPATTLPTSLWVARGHDSRDGGGRAASGDGMDAGGRATPGAVAGTAAEDVRSGAFSLPKVPGGKFPPWRRLHMYQDHPRR